MGEVLFPALEPILLEIAEKVIYQTKLVPSTDEETAIEELPCSCKVQRFSFPSEYLPLVEVF